MISRALIVTLMVVVLVITGCSPETAQPGKLAGEVTIGPIVPVERPGTQYEVPCEVYQARQVMVYDQDHAELIRQVDIDCAGLYQVDLAPGFYVIDINHAGIDTSSEVPHEVVIKSGETTQLDIDIDTGIR